MPESIKQARAQLEQYFNRLSLPEHHRKYHVSGLTPAEQFEYLARLQTYSLASIPFENLSLHYSPHRQVTLDPDELFRKQVENPGRGGYCMENNLVFNIVLRSLGFNLYSAGARVNEDGRYSGWSHMINLVTIGEHKYFVDVGFGPNGSIRPLRLDHDGQIIAHIAPASSRLVWKNIEPNTDPNQRLWVYQHRNDDDHDWKDMYCFTELEFTTADYQMMNYYTSTNSKTFFTYKIICAKMILGEDEELAGVVILQQEDLKWRFNGKTETQLKLKNEQERVEKLRDVFGISLKPSEQNGIRGLVTELR
ncbi:arylamine N-acetyltransferase 1 [Saccharata proteae CBS 121410]|uniref:Arylamine N-acetyltransferase 1 n=1 Tax=Saccharata proteae CBS 121410 TaxID=1314787 RepID=A0A6A5YFF3_9PEZI|nr:arylamine N-acetyltransferase 1 [Saccharata proteae CBS 121410]